MVRMRSSLGMNCDSTFKSVVLPLPVPPETTMFSLRSTQALMKRAISAVIEPKETSRSTVSLSLKNLRMEMVVPLRAIGGSTTWMRDPSGRRASRRGRSSLSGRPTNWAMLRAAAINPSGVKVVVVLVSLPFFSIQMSSSPLIMISETSSSSRYWRIGLRNARSESE